MLILFNGHNRGDFAIGLAGVQPAATGRRQFPYSGDFGRQVPHVDGDDSLERLQPAVIDTNPPSNNISAGGGQ